jgi:hypothetical protein
MPLPQINGRASGPFNQPVAVSVVYVPGGLERLKRKYPEISVCAEELDH